MERGKHFRKWLWISWDPESINRPRADLTWLEENLLSLAFSIGNGTNDPVFLVEAQVRIPSRFARLLP